MSAPGKGLRRATGCLLKWELPPGNLGGLDHHGQDLHLVPPGLALDMQIGI